MSKGDLANLWPTFSLSVMLLVGWMPILAPTTYLLFRRTAFQRRLLFVVVIASLTYGLPLAILMSFEFLLIFFPYDIFASWLQGIWLGATWLRPAIKSVENVVHTYWLYFTLALLPASMFAWSIFLSFHLGKRWPTLVSAAYPNSSKLAPEAAAPKSGA